MPFHIHTRIASRTYPLSGKMPDGSMFVAIILRFHAMKHEYIITVTYDPEHKVYLGWSDAVPGLHVCCPTLEELMEVVEDALPEMVEANAAKQHSVAPVPLYHMAKYSELRT